MSMVVSFKCIFCMFASFLNCFHLYKQKLGGWKRNKKVRRVREEKRKKEKESYLDKTNKPEVKGRKRGKMEIEKEGVPPSMQ